MSAGRTHASRATRQRLRQGFRAAVWGLLGADAGIRLAGRVRAEIGPVVASARVITAARPGTTISVPPLGSARLATHKGTVRVAVEVTGVDEDAARRLAGHLDVDALGSDARHQATAAGRTLAVRTLGAGVGGAALAAGAATRRPGGAVLGGLAAAGMLAAQAGLAAVTLRKDAWKNPDFTGLLRHVPSVVGRVEQIPTRLERYRKQIGEITASVTGVVQGLDALPEAPPADAIRLVWVSDIHNNPIAFDAVRALVGQTSAHAVVDSGDLVDWGTSAEERLLAPIGDLGVPYVFVKGNHDSAGIAAAVAKFPNAVVCDGPEPHVVAGLRFVGVADPRCTPDKTSGGDELDTGHLRELGRQYADSLSTEDPADVAVVHSPVMAEALAGRIPLVLSGHTHKRAERRADGTLLLVEGSSGGAGLRGVRQDPPLPLELSVLHLDRATRRLHTLDQLRIGGLGRTEVTLVRRRSAEVAPDGADAKAPS